ncbi:MAG: NAD(P)H-hydrate epimerase, partial [Acutalibacteraceae bacterium]|nr:NAD(P)H-hydrate epimerase [Acutalibacteraceae bacterium]
MADSNTMRGIESAAVNSGVSLEELMEKAGTETAALAAKLIAEKKLQQVCVLCGAGNNGGDGFVIARLLSDLTHVTVILTAGEPGTELSRKNFDLLPQNVRVCYYGNQYYECIGLVREADMLIDAIYGIGFHGMLQADMADLIGF